MKSKFRGFTLIEMLIVVIILGILGVIAIAQFNGVGQTTRENTLRETILQIRTQVTRYTVQHRDVPPAAATFSQQLTNFTDEDGNVGPGPAFPYQYGPYMAMVSPNSLNGLRTIKLIGPTATPVADNATGWIYQILPGRFNIWVNSTGVDSNGKPFVEY